MGWIETISKFNGFLYIYFWMKEIAFSGLQNTGSRLYSNYLLGAFIVFNWNVYAGFNI